MIQLHKVGYISELIAFNVGTKSYPVKDWFPKVIEIKTFCFECNGTREMEGLHYRQLFNDKPCIYGICSECDGDVSRILQDGESAVESKKYYDAMTADEAFEKFPQWTEADEKRLEFLRKQSERMANNFEKQKERQQDKDDETNGDN